MMMVSVTITFVLVSYAAVVFVSHKYSFFTVTSGSMEPHMTPGDLIVVDPNVPSTSVQKGDVIVYYAADAIGVISHRVIASYTTDFRVDSFLNGNRIIHQHVVVTKGDANLRPIYGVDVSIMKQYYIGKSVYVIMGGAELLNWLSPSKESAG